MPSLIHGYQHDIFISYRQADNEYGGWVSEFVEKLTHEIKATIKESISIYYDENPNEGLGETHDVDQSLASKLKCLIFIPIISKTYCDPDSFAWADEFLAFNKMAGEDRFGPNVTLPNGNTAHRILPIKIHELDEADKKLVENEIGHLRPVNFVYQSAGVNRPLRAVEDDPASNLNKTFYRDQINKVANAIQEIMAGLKNWGDAVDDDSQESKVKPSTIIKFRSELKRRSVLRASLAYILSSLILWKVASTGIEMLELPAGSLFFVKIVLIALFPVAVIMSWVYERSPQGFIKTTSAASIENPFTNTKKKPFTSNTFLLLLVITVTTLFIILPQTTGLNKSSGSEAYNSIAVLPFDDMSPGKDHEYLGDGIAEEIINTLTKFPEFKVVGRTSSFSFKGKDTDIQSIGKKLKVSSILEGSIKKSGDRIRITAQLIDVESGFHIWSKKFESNQEDYFAIEDSVASLVISYITPQGDNLLQNFNQSVKPLNYQAHDYFLKGKYISENVYQVSFQDQDFKEAESMFKKALKIDNSYAQAHAGLSDIYDSHSRSHKLSDIEQAKYIHLTREEIHMAYLLDPNHDYVNRIKGWIHLHAGEDEEALNSFKNAVDLNPKEAWNHIGLTIFLLEKGLYDEALKAINAAIDIDPVFSIPYFIRGILYMHSGKYDLGVNDYSRTMEIDSNNVNGYYWLSVQYELMHNKSDANKIWELLEKRAPGLRETLKIPVNIFYGSESFTAFKEGEIVKNLLEGHYPEAVEIIKKSNDLIFNFHMLINMPLFDPIREDPTFNKLLERKKIEHNRIKQKFGYL